MIRRRHATGATRKPDFRALPHRSPSRAAIAALATALAGSLLASAPAVAQQPPSAPTPSEAAEALDNAEDALEPGPGAPPPAPTVALNQLAASLPVLEGAERRRANGLLARPTDANDRYGDSYPAAAPVASTESPHFCVFWVNDPAYEDAPNLADSDGIADGDGVPDYVEAMVAIAEHSYAVEVSPGPLGWRAPKRDRGGCGADPGARADVYLKQLGRQGLFGYESPDPGQGRRRSQYGYLVLDDDYAPAEYGNFADPLAPAKVTLAHEFNHLLQQAYDSFQDVWMFESTAVWVEDKVYPEADDYVNFLDGFARTPGAPITDVGAANGLKIYGSGVWSHWLDRGGGGYGDDAILRAWEVSDLVDPADLAIAAYDRAIREHGGKGFSREFVRFAAATAEWRAGAGGFPDSASYPDMRRRGTLRAGRRVRFELDHTGYRLFDVKRSGRLQLRLEAERGVRTGLALVARRGDVIGGTVTRKTRYLRRGGNASLSLSRTSRFDRITALVINADGRVRGFSGGDWDYAKDNREFELRVSG